MLVTSLNTLCWGQFCKSLRTIHGNAEGVFEFFKFQGWQAIKLNGNNGFFETGATFFTDITPSKSSS